MQETDIILIKNSDGLREEAPAGTLSGRQAAFPNVDAPCWDTLHGAKKFFGICECSSQQSSSAI